MENGREVKKSFCLLSVAYIVLGLVLVIWPDISVHTFCFVFGIGMIIFGGAHLILYFTKDRFLNVMQPDLVIGVVCISTGCYILLKMEYMLEIIPFAMGIVALLGGIVKIQSALDLKKLGAVRWYVMLVWALVLLVMGAILVANPFDEQQKVVVILTGASLLVDGIGNLISIFWTGICFRRLKRMPADPYAVSTKGADIIDMEEQEEDSQTDGKKKSWKGSGKEKNSKIVGSSTFFRKKAAKEGKTEEEELPVYRDCETDVIDSDADNADVSMTDTEILTEEESEETEESSNEKTEPVEDKEETPDEE